VEEAQHQYVVPEKFETIHVYLGILIGPTIQKMYKEWEREK